MTTCDKREPRKDTSRALQAPAVGLSTAPGTGVWAGSKPTKPEDDSLRRYAADRLRHFAVR